MTRWHDNNDCKLCKLCSMHDHIIIRLSVAYLAEIFLGDVNNKEE